MAPLSGQIAPSTRSEEAKTNDFEQVHDPNVYVIASSSLVRVSIYIYIFYFFLVYYITCMWTLESVSLMVWSLLNQVAVGNGNPTYGMWIEKSSPALTVMSLTPDKSKHGLLACSSTKTFTLGRLGFDRPASLTAITRHWYSSPSFRFPTCWIQTACSWTFSWHKHNAFTVPCTKSNI